MAFFVILQYSVDNVLWFAFAKLISWPLRLYVLCFMKITVFDLHSTIYIHMHSTLEVSTLKLTAINLQLY